MEERYDKASINSLLERVKGDANDKNSLALLYKEMYSPVYKTALKYLNALRPSCGQNRIDAQDIAGDTFVTVIKKIDKLRHIENGAAWILKIAERHAKKLVFKRRRETAAQTEIVDPNAQSNLENNAVASSILDGLNRREFKIVLLHYYFGYTYSEISSIIKKSESTIKQTISSIKKRNQISDC